MPIEKRAKNLFSKERKRFQDNFKIVSVYKDVCVYIYLCVYIYVSHIRNSSTI